MNEVEIKTESNLQEENQITVPVILPEKLAVNVIKRVGRIDRFDPEFADCVNDFYF